MINIPVSHATPEEIDAAITAAENAQGGETMIVILHGGPGAGDTERLYELADFAETIKVEVVAPRDLGPAMGLDRPAPAPSMLATYRFTHHDGERHHFRFTGDVDGEAVSAEGGRT